jgi:hypothetical protein
MKLVSLNLFCSLAFIFYLFNRVELLKNFSTTKIKSIFKINKSIYDFSDNSKRKDLFRDKTLKVIKKLNAVAKTRLYLIILPNLNSIKYNFTNLEEFSEDLHSKIPLHDKNYPTSNNTFILTITNKEKNCEFFYKNNFDLNTANENINKIKNLFSEKEIEKLKHTFIKDFESGGLYYSAYYLIKSIYRKISDMNYNHKHPHRIHHIRYPVRHITTSDPYDSEKGEMIKSLFILPIIILICYSYFSGKIFIEPKEKKIDFSKIRIQRTEIKDMIDKNCIICLEDFVHKTLLSKNDSETILLVKDKQYKNRSNKIMKLPCGHFFHPNCIVKWMNTQKTCPTCRKEVELDTINLYQIEDKS